MTRETLLARGRLWAVVATATLLASEARPQGDPTPTRYGLEAGAFSVGFRRIEAQDPTRMVTGGEAGQAPRPRPVAIYLWYPAAVSDDAARMRFGDYAALADDDFWPDAVATRLEYGQWILARTLGMDRYEALLERPVLATQNAEPIDGKFPLVVIGQGLDFEYPNAFAARAEFLAGRGFVVATCPLVGSDAAFVRVDARDFETEVRDLELVIARVRESAAAFVSSERLGVFGFDMGGMAGLTLTMRNPDVDAFVSLDAGVLFDHPSALPRGAVDYDPLALRAPWLHGTRRAGATRAEDSQAESLFETAVHSERYLLASME